MFVKLVLDFLIRVELVCNEPCDIHSTHAMRQTTGHLSVWSQEVGLLSYDGKGDLILRSLREKCMDCVCLQSRWNLFEINEG